MRSASKTSRILGAAFLFQFVTSFTSNVFLRPLWSVDGDMAQSLFNIAEKPWLLRLCILLDMLTALGVIFLGAILFVTLRKQNEKMALTALGFYVLEGALLGASRVAAFPLIGLSQEFVITGQPAGLLLSAKLAFDSMEFVGNTLHVLAFCAGAIPFYYLLNKSRLVPRPLSLWGLVTVLPFALGMPSAVLGYEFPFIVYVPYAPFELVIGVWILVKGIKDGSEIEMVIGQGHLPEQALG